METSSESAGDGDVERYERLRRCALGGDSDGYRLGLALLERRELAAWTRAWPAAAAASSPLPTRPAMGPTADADELVGVLASMALACLAGR